MNLPLIRLSHLSTGAGRPVLTDYRSHEWYVLTERYITWIYRPTDTMDEIDVLLVTAPVTADIGSRNVAIMTPDLQLAQIQYHSDISHIAISHSHTLSSLARHAHKAVTTGLLQGLASGHFCEADRMLR